jgi:hypothetical protein
VILFQKAFFCFHRRKPTAVSHELESQGAACCVGVWMAVGTGYGADVTLETDST